MKKYILVYDNSSRILAKHFNDFKKIELTFPNKVSYSIEELKPILEILSKRDLKHSIILMGSNRKHWMTYLLVKLLKPKVYLHIDQHSDDYELVSGISGGNFVKFIHELDIPIFYIGFLKPEHPKMFHSYFLIRKDHSNLEQVQDFLEKIYKKDIYVSIDLDILKRTFVCNAFNSYSFLLSLKELLSILYYIPKRILTVDVTGFQMLKKCNISKALSTIENIVNFLEDRCVV